MIRPDAAASESTGRRVILGPFNRVEGDLEVRLDIEGDRVAAAHVNATMFRGFEPMLIGRDPLDVLTIVPRICGICSVSQSIAAARALGDAWGLRPPANGQIALNLMLACENLADHLTHFYLFFMPDFARACYAARPWHREATRRFAALGAGTPGAHSVAATAARARWFELMGTLGGKWPHTGSIVPGGSARALESSERMRLLTRVREMRAFLERMLFGAPLETVASLSGAGELMAWGTQGDAGAAASDLRLILDIADDQSLATLGRGPARVMSYGTWPDADGVPVLASGCLDLARDLVASVPVDQIAEDAHFAWLDDATAPLHPSVGVTMPAPDKPEAYTWNKAPRLGGRVVEVGAHARQLVDGHPLMRALTDVDGASVFTRVIGRLLEIARIVPMMEAWLQRLEARAPYAVQARPVDAASGAGLAEAARGALGHWLRIEHGRIASYQIIAPTSWNFSPRDRSGVPGPLEAALVGVEVEGGGAAGSVCAGRGSNVGRDAYVRVQHVVRSFDPCMVCTVH